MTYDTNQEAAAREATPELYRFSCGSSVTCYTSYGVGIWFLGEYYEPRSVTRSGFTEGIDFNAVTMTITAPAATEFLKYVANSPLEPARVKVYRAILSNIIDYRLLFQGVMLRPTFEKNTILMEFESLAHIFKRKYPRYVYQAWCNHFLFDDGCKLLASQWAVSGTVGSISGGSISVAACAAYGVDYFTGGHVQVGNDFRLITGHDGITLDLQMAFDSRVVAGTSVIVYPGCTGDPDICESRFDNRANFFGMTYIPSHNPVVWGGIK